LIKILVVITYYYPHWTGLTAFAQRMAEGLAARGHQVTVLTCRYREDLPLEDMHNGVRIVRIPGWFRLSRGQVMPGFIPALMRLMREHDVVQTHTPMLETWLVGMVAHRMGRKMLMTHHGDLVMPAGFFNQFVQKTVGFMLDQGARAADTISIYTRDYAQNSDFLRPHTQKVVTVYPPVVFPRAKPQEAAAWRHELGLDDYKLVAFAGRFVEEKGFDYLLKAMPLVCAQMPQVKFIYAGEHKVVYENFYQRCLPLIEAYREHIVMLGLITDHQKLANYYAMCDVFTLPSRTDCLASVQVEAMLCGTPVVATNIPGAREAVRVTGMGLLVEPCNERALADGLLQVLAHREEYVKPYEHIRSIFDADKSILDYEQLLQGMCKPRTT
jgi:glycosyltransferase involved in cell wall biosynthesis